MTDNTVNFKTLTVKHLPLRHSSSQLFIYNTIRSCGCYLYLMNLFKAPMHCNTLWKNFVLTTFIQPASAHYSRIEGKTELSLPIEVLVLTRFDVARFCKPVNFDRHCEPLFSGKNLSQRINHAITTKRIFPNFSEQKKHFCKVSSSIKYSESF